MRAARAAALVDNARPRHYAQPMLRLLALSLLALAGPQAVAEQVHPCQAQTPPCSLAMAQARHYLDELDRQAGNFVAPPDAPSAISPELAQTLRAKEKASRYLDELWRETGPGTPAWDQAPAPPEPRRYVPYPLSRELLTGAVNPCAGSRPACPWELENIYDGLERNSDDKNSWHYEYYLFRLEKYYRNHQP